MPSIMTFLKSLQDLPFAVFIHKTPWALTAVMVVHVFAVSMLIGTIAIVDLRLLGLWAGRRPFAELSRRVLPFTWVAFMIALIAGLTLFTTRATEYVVNAIFWIKMALIVLAGINMMIFEFITVRGVAHWNLSPRPPTPARLAGGISILCWIAVIACGRLIGFTLMTE
jgi:hypothetical protein